MIGWKKNYQVFSQIKLIKNFKIMKEYFMEKKKKRKQTKQIIGKNRDYLITMDKELIPIKDIEDIEINNEKKV